MNSSKTSQAMKENSYFIVNSKGEAFAIRAYDGALYFTSIWSDEIQRWRNKTAAKESLAFYQERAKMLNLFSEFQNCKIMKVSIVETKVKSIVIEDADDIGSSRQ